MKIIFQFALFLFLCFISSSLLADAGKALKLYEKRDFEKLSAYLDKSLEKDSLAPGIKYVHSLLLLDTGYAGYNIDSAYLFILDGRKSLAQLEEKDRNKLHKNGITDSVLANQKARVEQHAFSRARKDHSIKSYDYFIDFFSTASQLDSAVMFRDEIAYEDALRENTYQAFEYFFTTYPHAIQVGEATENYERLLFQSKTGEGKLENYISFLKNNPDTPHRNEAELDILQLATADNKVKSYTWFLDSYPNSIHHKKAENYLYYLLLESQSPQEIITNNPYFSENDSIQNIAKISEEVLLPVLENSRYSFIDLNGNINQKFSFDSISAKLICGDFTTDFIEAYTKDSLFLVALDGSNFYEGKLQEVHALGGGILALKNKGRYTLLHKSGQIISQQSFDDVEYLDHTFIKFLQNGQWGLLSVMGKEILPAAYDQIEAESGFIVIQKGDHMAISNAEQLKGAAQGDEIPLFFSYDDYFAIDDTHLIVISGDREALLDRQLKTVINLEKHKIDRFYGGWIVKSSKGNQLYNEKYQLLSGEYYNRILNDPNKIAFQLNGLWGISFSNQEFSQELNYDSVYFLYDNITLLFNQDNTYARFSSDSLIKIGDYQKLSLLKPQIANSKTKIPGYLLIENSKGISTVLDQNGQEVLKGKFSKIEALGSEYLVVTRNNKKGLYQSDGKLLLRTSYQGISNYNQGYVSTMLHNKFGIYHYKDELLLSAKHTKTLKPYGEQYFISESNGRFAFVNRDNDFITEYQFVKIEYWNDTSAIVKGDDYWQIFDIKNNTIVYDGIELIDEFKSEGKEKLLLITKDNQNGVLSSVDGEIIGPTFHDIYNVGTPQHPVFFAEKYIKEAEFYIVIYYKKSGDIIRKQVFTDDEYWKIYCPE